MFGGSMDAMVAVRATTSSCAEGAVVVRPVLRAAMANLHANQVVGAAKVSIPDK